MQPDKQVTEIRIGRVPAIRRRLFRRWRWNATHYRVTAPLDQHGAVIEARQHLIGDLGFAYTRMGAAIAAGRKVRC